MNKKVFSRSSILVVLGSTLFGNFLISPAIAGQDHFYPAIQVAQQNRKPAQPNMIQALSSLREAQKSLEKATADKGGYRIKALDLVKQASKETQLGIEFDQTNPNNRGRSENVSQRRTGAAPQNSEYQPNMQHALSSLMDAQRFLQGATSDKGGHRTKALELVNQAMKESKLGIEYDLAHKNDDRNSSYQPNMRQALSSLQEAQRFLQGATSDKGGYRVKALEFVEQAMRETRQGIEFDQTNRNDN